MNSISVEKKKEYNNTYLLKHKEKLLYETFICDLCDGKYKKINKDHHNKTQKHSLALRLKERFSNS